MRFPAQEVQNAIDQFGLPELPEQDEDDSGETAELVLFRFQQDKISLGDGFTIADAQEYCSRDDTHGDGWFTGYYKR